MGVGMMQTLHDWALKWGVQYPALNDLRLAMGIDYSRPYMLDEARTEAGVQQNLRLLAPEHGVYLWRNNVGATKDEYGNYFRFGLANDTSAMNKSIKSSDLIGITPVVITQDMVGQTVGIFTSYEMKAPGWTFTGDTREIAQAAWIGLVIGAGGIARFVSDVKEVWDE